MVATTKAVNIMCNFCSQRHLLNEVTFVFLLLGNEWKVNSKCKDVDKDFVIPPPCSNFIERKKLATEQCDKLLSSTFSGLSFCSSRLQQQQLISLLLSLSIYHLYSL